MRRTSVSVPCTGERFTSAIAPSFIYQLINGSTATQECGGHVLTSIPRAESLSLPSDKFRTWIYFLIQKYERICSEPRNGHRTQKWLLAKSTKERVIKTDEPHLPATWFGLVCDKLREHDSPLRGFLTIRGVRMRLVVHNRIP